MRIRLSLLLFSLALTITGAAFAASATWKTNPASGDWNTAANWAPSTVPHNPSDTATFATSNTTQVSFSADTEVDGIVFAAGASAFTISTNSAIFQFDGAGIVNNSGVTQTFVAGPSGGFIGFNNNSTAGDRTLFMFDPDGTIVLSGFASAGNATFLIPENTAKGKVGGFMLIGNSSTAARASFTINGGAVRGARGGFVGFIGEATAGHGTFLVNGGAGNNIDGGEVSFDQHSTAGDATLIANGGSNGGLCGSIVLGQSSHGDKARVELFGNGELDISSHNGANVVVGSIEGDGNVFLGANNLTVGANGLSTTFSGVIRDGGGNGGVGGSITKIGKSKLVLRHRNTYTGGTTVKHGKLVVDNATGSGTGAGPVQVEGGELAGKGIIAGAATVGTGSGPGAILSPGFLHGLGSPGALTIQSSLRFNGDSIYQVESNSSDLTADEVIAKGVTINSGAQFSFADIGNSILSVGTVFTIIDNTSASPIAGTFSNLADGMTFTSNGNTYRANYHGGDGNDLTLTVQQIEVTFAADFYGR